MTNLCSRLNNRVALYGKIEAINELGEKDYQYQKIKTIWAEVLPQSGSEKVGQGNTIFAEISHKFTVRTKAIDSLSNDMYFIFEGQKYDIKYFQPNYKWHDRIEIFCKLVVK